MHKEQMSIPGGNIVNFMKFISNDFMDNYLTTILYMQHIPYERKMQGSFRCQIICPTIRSARSQCRREILGVVSEKGQICCRKVRTRLTRDFPSIILTVKCGSTKLRRACAHNLITQLNLLFNSISSTTMRLKL